MRPKSETSNFELLVPSKGISYFRKYRMDEKVSVIDSKIGQLQKSGTVFQPYNLTTNQRAPRSQKWAGAEVTLRTAWIKSPILPGFSLNDPPAVGSSKQVTILKGTAVVRDVWR